MILNIPNCSCTMSTAPISTTMSMPLTYEYEKDGYIYFNDGYFGVIVGNNIFTIERPKIEPIVATAPPPEPPEPKLNAISCPGCGSGRVKATNITGIVECEYCGRQFTLSY